MISAIHILSFVHFYTRFPVVKQANKTLIAKEPLGRPKARPLVKNRVVTDSPMEEADILNSMLGKWFYSSTIYIVSYTELSGDLVASTPQGQNRQRILPEDNEDVILPPPGSSILFSHYLIDSNR